MQLFDILITLGSSCKQHSSMYSSKKQFFNFLSKAFWVSNKV